MSTRTTILKLVRPVENNPTSYERARQALHFSKVILPILTFNGLEEAAGCIAGRATKPFSSRRATLSRARTHGRGRRRK
jgi:hypothetical protein